MVTPRDRSRRQAPHVLVTLVETKVSQWRWRNQRFVLTLLTVVLTERAMRAASSTLASTAPASFSISAASSLT
jgi:hypothetical protein